MSGLSALTLAGCQQPANTTPQMVFKSLGINEGPALVYYTSSLCGSHSLANLTLIAEELSGKIKIGKPYAIDILGTSPKGKQETIAKKIGDSKHPYGDLVTYTNHARIGVSAGPDAKVALRDARTLGITVNSQNLMNHTGEILLIDANLNIIGKRLSTEDPTETIKLYTQALQRAQNTGVQR